MSSTASIHSTKGNAMKAVQAIQRQGLPDGLVLAPDNGVAWIVQDNLLNTYDPAGSPYSNSRP